jgi:hypothetical protein
MLYMDEIEPSLPFWLETAGMEVVAKLEKGGRLNFVLLRKDAAELMIQTRELVRTEAPYAVPYMNPSACLYIDVDRLGPILDKLHSDQVVRAVYKTSYGTTEIVLREPGGNLVGFASHE